MQLSGKGNNVRPHARINKQTWEKSERGRFIEDRQDATLTGVQSLTEGAWDHKKNQGNAPQEAHTPGTESKDDCTGFMKTGFHTEIIHSKSKL